MLLQPTEDNSQMIKRKRKHHNTIISGRKFTGTLTTDDYQIENIEYAVNDYVEFCDESGRVEKGIIANTDFNSVLVRYLGSTRKE